MTDARALLNRITAFRERLEKMPRLMPDRDVHPVPNLPSNQEPETVTAPASDVPAELGERARKCLEQALSLIADLNTLGEMQVVRDWQALVLHHGEAASLMDGAVRMLRHYPEGVEARWTWNASLDAALQAVRGRVRELKLAAGRLEKDRVRIDRWAEILWKLHLDEGVAKAEVDSFAAELVEDFKSEPIHWSGIAVDRSNLCRSVAAHAIDLARVVARLKPELVPAALLCDVGMPAMNATDLEAHVLVGVDLLKKRFPDAGEWIEPVEHHHERLDGSGYPHAWKTDRLSYDSKLLAVADAYVRRVTGWPTGAHEEPRTALTDLLLEAERGAFDADAVQALLAIGFHPVGSVVELGDGSLAGVVAGPRDAGAVKLLAKPVVQRLIDADGEPLSAGEFIDLEMAGGTVVRTLPPFERAAKLGRCHLSWAV